MRKTILALAAASMTLPVVVMPTAAQARHHYYSNSYRGRAYSNTYCHRRSGTTGTVVGAVGGGLLGHSIAGGTAGTLIGAGAGALLGRHVEKHSLGPKCRSYYR
ncbi:MAG: glycine zipper 2TM domain-containing protein [Sphingomicrobium sp.]